MEAPQRQDFLQTFAEVDGLIRRERPALPTVGWIPWPVDGRQLGAHVKPLITKINALKREIEEPKLSGIKNPCSLLFFKVSDTMYMSA